MMWNKNHDRNTLKEIFAALDRPTTPSELPRRIELCQQALELIPREMQPELWGMLQDDLASCLAQTSMGSRAENLEQAIQHFQQALKVRTRERDPYEWASTQHNLATAYRDRIRGDQAENIEWAIDHYQQALQVRTRQTFPWEWAMTQHHLAGAYYLRIRGDRAENLERAIQYFEQVLEFRTRQGPPEELASTQNDLGTVYRERIRGGRAENMETAIQYYEQALNVRTRQADPERWALTQNNLADAYSKRIRGARAENLERAIQYADQALDVFTRQAFPEGWAQVQNTLGEIYRVRIRESRRANIEKAIQHFQQALDVYTRQEFPRDWAMVQHNLGAAYTVHVGDGRAENIENGLRHFQLALNVYTRQAFPQGWASVQDNLANAYRYRIRGDRLKNLEQAIDHGEQALEVRTHQAFPQDWAKTQNNLANAYRYRLLGEREENIEQAIQHYRKALEVYTEQTFPEDWARVQNSLGEAYRTRLRGEQANNIEESIRYYQRALKVRTRETFPEDWAETLNNLAGAERLHDGETENIEQAVRDLQQILDVYTRDAFPREWARTHNNLGMVYADRKQGERKENVEHAMHHFQRALEVYTPQAFSERCLKAARGLGGLAFDERRWELARDAYETALSAQDALLQSSFSPASEKAELGELQNVPARAAYAHVKLGNPRRALEVLEKGRAQLLRESYEYQRQSLERLPALGFKKRYEEYVHARDEYQALQTLEMPNNTRSADWKQAQQKVQTAANAIREEAGQRYPQYRYFLKTLPFAEIQEQARVRPLIYLCSTTAGGLALVVTHQDVQVIEIPELEQEALQKQIWRPSNQEIDRINAHIQRGMITSEDIRAVSGGYFSVYALWSLIPTLPRLRISDEMASTLFAAWQATLDETTHWLWEVVMGKLISILKEHHESVTLLPAAQLALLPLHAAWTEDSSRPRGRRYALDEINISYAPSSHVLWQANLAAERPAESLMAVDNPDGTLEHSEEEVSAALDVFEQSTCLSGKEATLAAVKQEMQKAHVLHFSTHGRAGWEKADQAHLKLAGDNLLTLPDIFTLDLQQARLAVLSACETGVSGLELIDEMIGLPAGMMQAGVPGVVGSLWFVNDRSTALLMKRFYKFWRTEGKTPQDALRQAQIWLRDRLYDSPYYWAAFTYTGV